MATFTTYAEILTRDDVAYKMYEAGIRKSLPGSLLQDMLKQTGGVYEIQLDLGEKFREEIRQVAELTSDQRLLEIASHPKAPVSLEQFRHVDPRTTRIVCGHVLTYEPGESEQLGLKHEGPYDPRNTIAT
jgi:hypothetical protein